MSLWKIGEKRSISPDLDIASSQRKLHPVITQLLAQRGLRKQEEIEAFLAPQLSSLPAPLLMKGMREAVALVDEAIFNGTPIVIWGDYDVDGITGTALLVSFFQDLGVAVSFFIPNRMTHGYGLHLDILQSLTTADEPGKKLLITVDCGISAQQEILAAQKLGFQVIVTDHHEPPEIVQVAEAVLNPKQADCPFPTEELAGVGVAFYLACGIRQHLREKGFFHAQRPEPVVRDLLDLVALGTIADMVDLGQINRALVKAGTEIIEQQKRCGIQALLQMTGFCTSKKKALTPISSEDIGFVLAPMINAAGRLAEAELAVRLFLSTDEREALVMARQLSELNDKRKKIGQETYQQAAASIPETVADEQPHCLIIKGGYHHGVLGIVASKMVEKFHLPVILFGQKRDEKGRLILKGSGRSVPGINIHKALENCSECILRYGGHEMAVGLSLEDEQFELFVLKMNREIERQKGFEHVEKTLEIDLESNLDDIMSEYFCQQLTLLEPFGPGNRKPVFYTQKAQVNELKAVGNAGVHLKLTLRENKERHKGIGFGLGSLQQQLRHEKAPIIAYTPMINRFRDTISWEVRVVGIQTEGKTRKGE